MSFSLLVSIKYNCFCKLSVKREKFVHVKENQMNDRQQQAVAMDARKRREAAMQALREEQDLDNLKVLKEGNKTESSSRAHHFVQGAKMGL